MHRNKILAGYNLLQENILRKVGSATGKEFQRQSFLSVLMQKRLAYQ
jgi:hypothetical protein